MEILRVKIYPILWNVELKINEAKMSRNDVMQFYSKIKCVCIFQNFVHGFIVQKHKYLSNDQAY